MRLSALAIRNAKTREKAYKLGDGHGLYLLVKPSGTRLWRMNYAHMGDEARAIYRALQKATDAGINAARPGNTAADLFHAQVNAIRAEGIIPETQGRYGHGLGLTLTEWSSNAAHDETPLRPGMVMTIEPGIAYGDGKVMVHEENLVITEDGRELLSRRGVPELPVIGW